MGPRRPGRIVRIRREVVHELMDRGIKQKVIAQKLGYPLRTIQRDFAVIYAGLEEQLKRGLGLEELENRKDIQDWVAKRTIREVVDTMVDADVPVAPVYQVDQVVEDPHILSRGMIVSMEHPTAGMIKVPNFPVKFSNTPVEVRDPAPILGQHNEKVLTDLLGYRAEEIAKLRKEGVIF